MIKTPGIAWLHAIEGNGGTWRGAANASTDEIVGAMAMGAISPTANRPVNAIGANMSDFRIPRVGSHLPGGCVAHDGH